MDEDFPLDVPGEPNVISITCQFTIDKRYKRAHQMMVELQMGMMSPEGPYTRCAVQDVGDEWELSFAGVLPLEDEPEAWGDGLPDTDQIVSSNLHRSR